LSKLLALLGATIGGCLGWWLGAHAGVFLGFVLSIVGTGCGLYLGRRVSATCFSFVLILLGPVAPALTSQQPRAVARYPLRLVDLSLVADPVYGLQLVALPAPKAVMKGTGGDLVWLRFDPDTALAWLNAAAAVLRTAVPGGPVDAIQWSPTLRPVSGRGGFLLGRDRRKGVLGKAHWLALADSAPGWQAEITAQEADSLLHLFLALAPQARLDLSAGAAPDKDSVDRPVIVVQQPQPVSRGNRNRVAAQFVVGADGRVEPESFVVVLAASPRVASEAWEVVRASRFEPAQRQGRPVRQLVQLLIARP
jgi:hypothetical protein